MLHIDGREEEMGGAIWRMNSGHGFERVRIAVFHGGGCVAEKRSTMKLRNAQVFDWRG